MAADLTELFSKPPSLADFQAAIARKRGGSTGGMSGLTYEMVKHWPDDVVYMVYDLIVAMWTDKTVPSS